MSWSLHVSHGDLALSSNGIGSISGPQKLAQDLRCYILEKMGTDDMHPDYGSLINGGRDSTGRELTGLVGQKDDAILQTQLEAEIRRIVTTYQTQQLARAQNDRIVYGKATLTRGEALMGLQRVDMNQNGDTLNVTLTLLTAAQSPIQVALAFEDF